jgi:hypothetical protein
MLTRFAFEDFTKGHMAANYYFWISALEPTIQETADNRDKGPKDGCKSVKLSDVQFSYPLAPHNQVLKGVSLNVSQSSAPSWYQVLTSLNSRFSLASSSLLLDNPDVARAQ